MEALILEIVSFFVGLIISGFSAIVFSRFVPWYWDYLHGMTERNFIQYLFKGRD